MAIHITTKEIAEKIKLEGFVPKSLIDFKYFSELGKNGIYFYDNIRLVQQYAYFLKSKTNSELVMIKVKISSDIIEKTSNQEDGLFVSSENLKYVEIKNFETIKRISDLY